MFQVGVVGSASSVKRILELKNQVKEDIQFVTFPYTDYQETSDIVKKHNHHINIWFFSGELPYLIAAETLQTDDHMVYVENTEASLYRCFLQLKESGDVFLDRFSMDDTSNEIMQDAMAQLNYRPANVYLKTYGVGTNTKDLYEYHTELWREGKIDFVITSFEKVYEELKAAGIPAYWYTISNMEIKHSFRILNEKIMTFYFKDRQTGIVIIDIRDFHHIIEKARNPYQVQYLELRLKEALIQLCESLDGSVLEKGNGRYVIYSSRGALENGLQMVRQAIEQLKLESETSVSVGIGYGETVFSAELNALQAIHQSSERNEEEIVILQEDGKVVEAAGKEQELTYFNREDNELLIRKLKEANISLRTYKRLEALLNKMNQREFTTKDIVTHLEIEDRNARRIVSNLNKVGMIETIGEKALSTRGRPSKIYQLTQLKKE